MLWAELIQSWIHMSCGPYDQKRMILRVFKVRTTDLSDVPADGLA
jgi:hypothetical protein